MLGTTVTTVSEVAKTGIGDAIAKNLANQWIFIVVLALLFLLLVGVFLFRGKFSLKFPGGGLDLSSGDDKKKDEKKDKPTESPKVVSQTPQPQVSQGSSSTPESMKTRSIGATHASCPNVVDFKHVVTKTTYVVSKISEIKYRGCLSEQMGYAEEQMVSIRSDFQKCYLERLREKIKEKKDVARTEDEYLYEDYRFYQAVIKLLLHDIESVIRASFQNNHLTTYTSEKYQEYIDLKFGVIKGLEADFIDTMYVGAWILSRNDIFELHSDVRSSFKRKIENIYMKAREIAQSKQKEVNDLETELQEYLNETISGEIKIDKVQ